MAEAPFTDDLELQIVANTAKVGITLEQAADILVNNEKLSYLLGFTQQQADDIEANNQKVSAIETITSEQIADIQTNNNKISYDDAELVAELAQKIDSVAGQSTDVQAALDGASLPSISNPFTTLAQLNALASHASSVTNPHGVTASQVGLDQVDNTSDAQKPVSIATQNALDLKVDESTVLTAVPLGAVFTDTVYVHPATHEPTVINQNSTNRFVTDADLANLSQNTAHRTNTGNPHGVTAAQVGALDTAGAQALVTVHENRHDNPHQVNKTQVGLDQAENTSDLNKPVSTATQSALDLKADASRVLTQVPLLAEFTDTVYEHPATHPATIIVQDADYQFITSEQKTNLNSSYVHSQLTTSNPHQVTAAEVGLDQVDNTSDLDKPMSTATQTYVDDGLASVVVNANTDAAVAMAIALG